jgi:hypothetical protein
MPHTEALAIRLLLSVHFACGFLALIAAPIAMAVFKGGHIHRRWGRIFLVALAGIALTAPILAPYFHDELLIVVAILSFYLAFSGWRVLARKRPDRGERPGVADWLAAEVVILSGFVVIAVSLAAPRYDPRAALIAELIGVLAIAAGALDVCGFLRPPRQRTAWLFHHLRGMIAAYAAALTAFSVTNLRFLPLLPRWLWPAFAGALAVMLWSSHYRRRFGRYAAPAPQTPAYQLTAARTSASTAAAARFPGNPLTQPPGWVAEPHK